MNKPKLLEQVRNKIRFKHYSIRTEEAYIGWIKRFILFHKKRHPSEMGESEVSQFLTYLAVKGSHQNNLTFFALRFRTDLVDLIEQNRSNSSAISRIL